MMINVLGTEYDIETRLRENDGGLAENDGYCDDSVKKIVLADLTPEADDPGAKRDIEAVRKKILRHELAHAFLCESGLCECSEWAQNEELVDWIAIQGPKLWRAWMEAGAV